MTDPAIYRDEAERCRQMAASSADHETARRWLALADEYLQLALESAESERSRRRGAQRPAWQPPGRPGHSGPSP